MLDDLFPDRAKRERRPKDVKTKPEEPKYEPMGKLSDYWTTSSTLDYDYKYNNEK